MKKLATTQCAGMYVRRSKLGLEDGEGLHQKSQVRLAFASGT